LFTKRI